MPEVELEAVELKVPVEVCTEMVAPPSVASADSSASEPSGKPHPVALHTQAAVAAPASSAARPVGWLGQELTCGGTVPSPRRPGGAVKAQVVPTGRF